MRFTVAYAGLLAIAVVAIAGCTSDVATEPNARAGHPRGPSADLLDLGDFPVAHRQLATSEEFDGFGGTGATTYLADDFDVAANRILTLKEVGITGALHFNHLPFSIRRDLFGHPDEIVPNGDYSLDPLKADDSPFGGHNFLFSLPAPLVLTEGHYWLVIETGTPDDGTALWQLSDQANTLGLASLDNGDTWASLGHDYAFALFGTVNVTQTITLEPVAPNPAVVGSSASVVAGASSNLPVALAAGPAPVCTLAGTTLSFVGVGTCTLTANQAGEQDILPAPEATQDIGVIKASQTITFPPITPNPAAVGGSATLGATASSLLTVSYSSQTTNVCTVAGNTVSYVAVGTCTIAADQAGNGAYEPAAQTKQTVEVAKSKQTITFTTTAPQPGYINGTYTVGATGGPSGKPVIITVGTPNVCTITGAVVRFVGVGTCTIAANQAGNDAYSAATPVTQTVKVDYRYDGFLGSVKNGDVMNVAKTGQAIPLQWRLTDASGAPITTLASVTITIADLKCTLGTSGDQIAEQAAGGSGLQNLGNGYYQYNWKAPASYAKSCKLLQLDLGEGSGVRAAQFSFSK
jgi:hypothetical protein